MLEQVRTPESSEKRKPLVRITFLRHANKEQPDPHADGTISASGLSEKGKKASERFGVSDPFEGKVKVYSSSFDRSKQTAERIAAGVQMREDGQSYFENRDGSIEPRVRELLDAPRFSPQFIDEYRKHFAPMPEHVGSPDADEQERMIEEREAPAVDYWLSFAERKPDAETESPREVAERVAYWFDRLRSMAEKRNANEPTEIINVSHRTVLEPFLKDCLVTPIESIEEIGGPLQLLEGAHLDIYKNESGEYDYMLMFRNRVFKVDVSKVRSLADRYKERNDAT